MVVYIGSFPDGADSRHIAESVLKFQNPNAGLAHLAVCRILENDPRCALGEDGRWHIKPPCRSNETGMNTYKGAE